MCDGGDARKVLYKAVHVTDKSKSFFAHKGGFVYKVGETYTLAETPKLGVIGFHACATIPDCYFSRFGYTYPQDAILEVCLSGDVKTDARKWVGSAITIVRRVPDEEVAAALRGLACIRTGRSIHMYKDGLLHRDDDKPAAYTFGACGGCREEWWFEGRRHRSGDKPAIQDEEQAREEWWVGGVRHRDAKKPAVVDAKHYYKEHWVSGEFLGRSFVWY